MFDSILSAQAVKMIREHHIAEQQGRIHVVKVDHISLRGLARRGRARVARLAGGLHLSWPRHAPLRRAHG